jgi:RNA recognition motif-containing protein
MADEYRVGLVSDLVGVAESDFDPALASMFSSSGRASKGVFKLKRLMTDQPALPPPPPPREKKAKTAWGQQKNNSKQSLAKGPQVISTPPIDSILRMGGGTKLAVPMKAKNKAGFNKVQQPDTNHTTKRNKKFEDDEEVVSGGSVGNTGGSVQTTVNKKKDKKKKEKAEVHEEVEMEEKAKKDSGVDVGISVKDKAKKKKKNAVIHEEMEVEEKAIKNSEVDVDISVKDKAKKKKKKAEVYEEMEVEEKAIKDSGVDLDISVKDKAVKKKTKKDKKRKKNSVGTEEESANIADEDGDRQEELLEEQSMEVDDDNNEEELKPVVVKRTTQKPNTAESEESSKKSQLKTLIEKNAPKEKNDELEARTIYVGNVPKDINKQQLKKIFKEFGQIETIRLRCGAPDKPSKLKKVAINKYVIMLYNTFTHVDVDVLFKIVLFTFRKELHPDRNSVAAYVRYSSREEAEEAKRKATGLEFMEHHLTIDIADNSVKKDNRKGIFVGNLQLSKS